MAKMVYPKLCQSMTRSVRRKKHTRLAMASVGIEGGFCTSVHLAGLERYPSARYKDQICQRTLRGARMGNRSLLLERRKLGAGASGIISINGFETISGRISDS